MKILRPTEKKYVMTAPFGLSKTYFNRRVFHYGVDFACPTGTELLAIEAGIVEEVRKTYSPMIGYGKTITIKLKKNNKYTSFYGHCSKILAKEGQEVLEGDVVALSGATGYCVSSFVGGKGAHLHWGLKKNKEWVDPILYLSNHEESLQELSAKMQKEAEEAISKPEEQVIKIEDFIDDPNIDGEDEDNFFYIVQKGDSLSKIAKNLYGMANVWGVIFEANREIIFDADKIYPGQKIKIPKDVDIN